MASTSERGHAKNVANLNKLVIIVTGYGTTYNPSNPILALAALQVLNTNASASITAVNSALSAWNVAVSAREKLYKPLSKLVTRAINSLRASGTQKHLIANAKSIAAKISGQRSSSSGTTSADDGNTDENDESKSISVSQMSYDNRLSNFGKLIELLATITEYAPNEEELQVASLQSLHSDMNMKNDAVVAASAPLTTSRIARDLVLYTDTTGLCDVAAAVKNYIKSVFGAGSDQYKEVSRISFSKPPKD